MKKPKGDIKHSSKRSQKATHKQDDQMDVEEEKNGLEPVSKPDSRNETFPFCYRLDELNLTDDPHPRSKMIKLILDGFEHKNFEMHAKAFEVTDVKSITQTLQRLPPKLIPKLVKILAMFLQKSSILVSNLAIWFRILLQVHPQLMTSGNASDKEMLSLCLGAIEHRLEQLPILSSFAGRLDLLVAQHQAHQVSDEQSVAVYEESDNDVDARDGHSSSEGEAEEWTESDTDNENCNGLDQKEEMSE